MKTKITFALVIIIIMTFNVTAQNIDLNKGLVAYYPFNGNANDESGNGNHGIVYGATLTTDKNGKANNAYFFDGDNDYIYLKDISSIYNDNFTFLVWFNVANTTERKTLYSSGYLTSVRHEQLLIDVENKTLRVRNYYHSWKEYELSIVPEEWNNITIIKENSNYNIYYNNKFITKLFIHNIKTKPKDDFIGARNTNQQKSLFFKGKLDDIRIYNRALNVNEINALYSNKTEVIKLASVTWLSPIKSFEEISNSQYTIKANIQSEKQIKSIRVLNGYSTIVTENYFYLTNGKGVFEKDITLNSGNNEITIVVENEDGSVTSEKRTIKYNEPQVPPMLFLSNINFVDKNGNNRIDGNEDCFISFTISNKGKGSARNLKVKVENNSSIQGLNFSNISNVGNINPNATQTVNVPISGTMNLTSGTANIKVSFEEQMGFQPDPFELNIETKEFIKPNVQVVDHSFLTDNGIIQLGLPVQLKVLIQNIGQGIAENVNVSFQFPSANVFPNGPKDFEIGTLQPGATKELIFEFIANKIYTEKNIPVTARINEKYGRFSENKQVFANIDAKSSGTAINIASNVVDSKVNIQVASLTAEVDKNIPLNPIKYPDRYALIIGNEDYSSRQRGLGAEVDVAFAVNDAKIFKDYCVNTLGVEEKNVFFLTNATAGEMHQRIELATQILSRLGSKGELIFYYAGHGFPDENTKEPYLIPVDVTATNLSAAIKLNDVYKKFSQTGSKRISVFLDACFTGGGRESGLLAARAIKVRPREETISGNMVIFAATSEDQSALPYKDKQHGMFTYFLLKKLQETKGDVSYGALEEYIRNNVSIESLKINSKAQDPKANVSPQAKTEWETWKLK